MARARLTEAVAAAAAAALATGCGGSDNPGTAGPQCAAPSCDGATACYARCYCESADDLACRDSCQLPATSALVLDVSAWPADTGAEDLIASMNSLRSRGGCCAQDNCFPPSAPLVTDDALTQAARRHAADMASRGFFSHETPDGLTLSDRLRAAGFHGCVAGENLAASYATAAEVTAAWFASVDHCQNVLWPAFTHVGVADRASTSDPSIGMLWVADFGQGG